MKKTVVLVLAALLLMGVLFAGAASAAGSITINNATGNKDLTNVNDFIYGDYGPQNGTATLKYVGSGEDDPWILELDHFNATSNLETIPIIGSDVPLTVYVVNGTSRLTHTNMLFTGVLNSDKNLTIISDDLENDMLIVNATVAGNVAISSRDDLTLSHARFEANAPQALNSNSGNVIIDNHSVVSLNAEDEGIQTVMKDIMISNGSKVTIMGAGKAFNAGITTETPGQGNITITSDSRVDIHTQSEGLGGVGGFGAYADIMIDSAKVNITANSSFDDAGASGMFSVSGNITITNAADVKATVKTTGSVGEYGVSPEAYALYAMAGNVTIDSGSSVDAYANSATEEAAGIWAKKNITIDGATLKNVSAESAGDDKLAAGLYSDTGDISIASKAQVTAKANNTGESETDEDYAYGVWAKDGNITITGKNTLVDAQADCKSGHAYSILAGIPYGESDSSLRINDGCTVKTYACSLGDDREANAIYVAKNIEIDSAKKVTAKAIKHTSFGNARGLYAEKKCTIINTEIVAEAESDTGYSVAIASNEDMTIDSSKITADAKCLEGGNSNGISSSMQNVLIKGADTVIDVDCSGNIVDALQGNTIDIQAGTITTNAKSFKAEDGTPWYGYGIHVDESITISGCDRIKATGTNASFIINGELSDLDFDALKTGYIFSNATNPGSDPTSFEQFKNDWHYDTEWGLNFSNYSSVLIKKKITFSSSSSGSNGGATVILTETPTQVPTAAPTPVATIQPVGNSTLKPTTAKPTTSKSPAPLAGLIAGLGAATILMRMRR